MSGKVKSAKASYSNKASLRLGTLGLGAMNSHVGVRGFSRFVLASLQRDCAASLCVSNTLDVLAPMVGFEPTT